jgi:hypothetical protein
VKKITAASHQPRDTKFNVENPKLGEKPGDQASQIFFHYMLVGLQEVSL